MSRKEKVASFKIVHETNPVVDVVIPIDVKSRDELYNLFLYVYDIELPSYESFKKRKMKLNDMRVLMQDWTCSFWYDKNLYEVIVKKGACYDGASVPVFLIRHNIRKYSQQIIGPAILHDACFALKLFSFEDSNNIFRGYMEHNKINFFDKLQYICGVRSFIAHKLYKNCDSKLHWLNKFVTFKKYTNNDKITSSLKPSD